MTKEIVITKRNSDSFTVLIDDKYYDEVVKWKWSITQGYAYRRYYEPNSQNRDPAVKREAKSGGIALHQFIWFLEYKEVIDGSNEITLDHVNRNPLDNRLCNLRKATKEEQVLNRSYTKEKSGLRGTTKYGNKWRAQLTYEGKPRYLGLYNTELEAHQAYKDAYKRLRSVEASA